MNSTHMSFLIKEIKPIIKDIKPVYYKDKNLKIQ